MNILKKSIAPITDKAWEEITDQASAIFKTYLTARKFVDIDGPNGLEYGAVSTGRLIMPENKTKEGVNYGKREVLPLVEIRKPFELDLWELDNVNRGAKDVDLEPLENAAKEIALFEEKAIYKGFEYGEIVGLEKSVDHEKVKLSDDPNEFLKTIGGQVIQMQNDGVEGPYTLVVNEKKWKGLLSLSQGYPFTKQLEEIIKGKLIVNPHNENSYLLSERGEDFELVIGQDLSIGYDGHDTGKVKLYFSESFTFRVLTPEAVRILSAN